MKIITRNGKQVVEEFDAVAFRETGGVLGTFFTPLAEYKAKIKAKREPLEYKVRVIDADGDCLDVNHFTTKKEAMAYSHHCEGASSAVLVTRGDRTVTNWTGSRDALAAGGWIGAAQ